MIASRLSSLSAAVVLVSCGRPSPPARFSGGVYTKGTERFQVEAPTAPWQPIRSPAGDLAWEHPREHAVIAANATCEGHKDPPLTILLGDLLMGTGDRKVLMSERLAVSGREALHEVVALSLDGVPLVYDLYVLKKDGCVYDLSLVVPPRSYESVADEFVDFVASFDGLGRGSG